jgi:hypothetical protein
MKKPSDRRIPDPRLEKLVNEMDTVKIHLNENTRLTAVAAEKAELAAYKAEQMAGDVRDIKDIVRSFKLLGVLAGWAGGIVAAAVAIKTGWTNLVK